jgi:hypothetical protein
VYGDEVELWKSRDEDERRWGVHCGSEGKGTELHRLNSLIKVEGVRWLGG